MATTSSSNVGCIARIQHRWKVSPGHTYFHHHLRAGMLTVKAFNATKVYLGRAVPWPVHVHDTDPI
jgi:hypothetical protein